MESAQVPQSAPGPHILKVLIPLVVLIVLIVGYGALAKNNNWWPHDERIAVFQSPTPSTSEGNMTGEENIIGWKTYINEDYDFQFQYPQKDSPWQWRAHEEDYEGEGLVIAIDDGHNVLLNLTVETVPAVGQIGCSGNERETRWIFGIRIAGQKADMCKDVASGNDRWSATITKNVASGVRVYNFTCENESMNSDLCKEILYTFKFLPIVTSSERILIPRNQIEAFEPQLPDPCDFKSIEALHFTSDENEHVTYRSSKWGLEVSLPYNAMWGSPMYRLNPYDEYDNGVHFDTINFRAEGCGGWFPVLSIYFQRAESKEKVLARLHAESNAQEYPYQIETKVIAGKDVIEYTTDGICAGGDTIVIGKKYNYSFQSFCSGYTDEAMIASMKFIN